MQVLPWHFFFTYIQSIYICCMTTYVNTREYDIRTRTVVILDEEVVEERAEMAGAGLEKVIKGEDWRL